MSHIFIREDAFPSSCLRFSLREEQSTRYLSFRMRNILFLWVSAITLVFDRDDRFIFQELTIIQVRA